MAHQRPGAVFMAVAWCLAGGAFFGAIESTYAQHLNLVFANYQQSDRLCINDGTASFACHNLSTDVLRSTNVAAALLDGDNLTDFVFSVEWGPNRVCYNDGSDAFVCANVSALSRNTRDVAAADFNNDGAQDLVFANAGQPDEICLGDGAGAFSCSDMGTLMKTSNGVTTADFDGDDDVDVVFAVASRPHTVCLNNGAGQFACSDIGTSFGSAQRVAAADFNGDGHADVAFAEYGPSNRLCLGSGAGTFSCSNVEVASGMTFSVAAGDLNGDDAPDLAFGNVFSQSRVCLNSGAGTFSCSQISVGTGMTLGATAADLEGDGDVDLAFGVRDMPNRLCLNDGSGQFSCSNINAIADAAIGVIAAPLVQQPVVTDQDGDGVADALDLCPGTTRPEGVVDVRPNRWALMDDDGIFDTAPRGPTRRGGPKNSEVREEAVAGYSIEQTGGCSCEQIGAALGLQANESNFGCLSNTMDAWIAQISGGSVEQASDGSNSQPAAFSISGNYPNPFNPSTTVRFELRKADFVRMAVYDVLGREVAVLAEGLLEPGRHDVRFEAGMLPSGLYVSRLTTSVGWTERVMVLIK